MAQIVKHLPTTWETQVQSLGWEDLLEKDLATHSSILAWRIPWTRSLVSYSKVGFVTWGYEESETTEAT